MKRLGLALSGGGFRATLYHLGVVRCLRDAGVLPEVTHITTVSGGSILGAHLALNWNRYCGSDEEFDEAAAEIIRFVQLDVRNRIVRRFPLTSALNRIRAILLMGTRRHWTRAGLLEKYYQRFLFGDTPLSQLPQSPQLHILSTNLSEGCLCSFNQKGLLIQRRVAGRRDQFEHVDVGLATVPMAVAASSCFPGFFPPLELTGWDVGADSGEFAQQSFTDGGVYDNLGLRMFRCLEQLGIELGSQLGRNDFVEFEDTMSALHAADDLPDDMPLARLRILVDRYAPKPTKTKLTPRSKQFANAMLVGLREVIRTEKLYRDPVFANVEFDDPAARTLLNHVLESERDPEVGDSLWLNRMIVESALRQVVGKHCLRTNRNEFDGILVSDAGGKFKVSRDTRGGGLIRTALRSSDILMDRVWQLEQEAFETTSGVVFMPILQVVEPSDDAHSIDPELQRRAARIRTDVDYFSDLEVSTLIQHGYGVARQVCSRHEDLFGGEFRSGPSWNPLVDSNDREVNGPEKSILQDARRLRQGSKRKVLSTLLSLRDWPSYVWLSISLMLLIGVPYFVTQRSVRLRQQEAILTAVAELNPNYRKIVELLRNDPLPEIVPMDYETVTELKDEDLSGFEVISDSRVFDLRNWIDPSSKTSAMNYSRTRVRRLPEGTNNSVLRLQVDSEKDLFKAECKSVVLNPKLYRMKLDEGKYRWELRLDFARVPIGGHVDVQFRASLPPESAQTFGNEAHFDFSVMTKTGLIQIWLFMPEGREFGNFEVVSYPFGKPELTQVVVPSALVGVASESVITFRLINPNANHRYECRWKWENAGNE